jgi:hypothetical protein
MIKLTSREDYKLLGQYAKAYNRGEISRESIPYKYRIHLPETREEALRKQEEYRKEFDEEQERFSNSTTGKALDAVSKGLTTMIAVPSAAGSLGPIVAEPILKTTRRILTHPITEAVGTVTGLHNLVTDQGVKKTIDHVKNEKYGKAVLSGLGDVLDASPLLGVAKSAKAGYNALRAGNGIKNAAKTFVDNAPILKFGRMFSKANRAKHAFVTINPFGYGKPFKRGFKWLNSVLSDAPVDPNTFKARMEEFVPGMDPD